MAPVVDDPVSRLSGKAKTLLVAAAADSHGSINVMMGFVAASVQTGGRNFINDPADRREVAGWERVVGELESVGAITEHSRHQYGVVYRVTDAGYTMADRIRDDQGKPHDSSGMTAP